MTYKKIMLLLLTISLTGFLFACKPNVDPEQYDLFSEDQKITKIIRRVETFPDMPQDYEYYDYAAAAVELDDIVFSFAQTEEVIAPNYLPNSESSWNPIGFWDNARVGIPDSVQSIFYKKMSFGIPTYVGDRRSSSDGPYEGIATIPMVLGSSYVGIDKSNQVINSNAYNFVDMTKAFYNVGTNLVLNTTSNTIQGKSVWYDLYPQISFTRLFALYQEDIEMKTLVLNGAQKWLDALPFMVDENNNPDFEFTGFDVKFNSPFIGGWIDVPAGGLAFLFYSAYQITKEEKYLDGCKLTLDYLEDYTKNPNYEAMSDFSPYVAAALNAQYGTNYDVQKFIDYLFENDADYRSNWSILTGDFNGYPVDGLVGNQDYAFSMNSFNLASTLAPMAKYDGRFADAIGKYMLNLTNNAKWFFPQELSLNNQTMNNYLSFDPNGVIVYEGFRRSYQDVSPIAMGDATSMFSSPSDLSLYSASHIGYLGAIVSETNINGILSLDLNATDSFGQNSYPTHLYYNPFEMKKVIEVSVGTGYHDLFDSVTKQIVARNVTGTVRIDIPASSSRVIVTLPAMSKYQIVNNQILVNKIPIAYYQAAVNITSPGHSRYQLQTNDVIRFSYSIPKNDEITRMVVYYGDIIAYDGIAVNEIPYNKNILPDTDYVLKVIIYTKNGLRDQSSSRVICR
jgi:hypothetical protein